MATFKIDKKQLKWIDGCYINANLSDFIFYEYLKEGEKIVIGKKFITIKINAHYCVICNLLKEFHRKLPIVQRIEHRSSKSIIWVQFPMGRLLFMMI